MSTITKERAQEIFLGNGPEPTASEERELARIALASLEAEPVCVIDQSNLDYLKSGSDADVWPASRAEMGDVLLYRTAPPAPVSVPDEDLLHMAASAIEDLLDHCDPNTDYYSGVWADVPDKLRLAAMLQGADGNSPVIQDSWVACSERLPEVGEIVLTSDGTSINLGESERSGVNLRFFTSIFSGRELPATHWMPLPAAPQQEVK
ncbi:DUF551 domain-containing protein [Enterobacter roggenkampii]|uniref:DUF551 domain-containing protein n=1 Tax=Enterobacter roggenkampii TaxID=1812935 RepID=UPI00223739C0|nr:DUF551 domain-containing protein [Enterobacter roggenkampii]MCW5001013.1 DUF551 domain-containing protein [Enterobacter roggenkampii]